MSRQKEAVIAFCNDVAPEGENSNCKDLIFDLFHILTWVVFLDDSHLDKFIRIQKNDPITLKPNFNSKQDV